MELLQASVIGFENIKYIGAFSFAAGMAIMFIQLYVSNVKARIKDAQQDRDNWIKSNSKLMMIVEQQSEALKEVMDLKQAMQDLSKRIMRLESRSD